MRHRDGWNWSCTKGKQISLKQIHLRDQISSHKLKQNQDNTYSLKINRSNLHSVGEKWEVDKSHAPGG